MMEEDLFSCALPISEQAYITLAHGAGGSLTQQLLTTVFRPAFNNSILAQQHDAALLSLPSQRIALTTDSYVITPLFFPDSDIGALSLIGTINDLAMSGAQALYITCGFILTEGLLIKDLKQIVASMRHIALSTGVQIVAGDIKVVEKTAEPGLYINTTGVGILPPEPIPCPQQIQNNDAIIVSGDIGRHGLAILGARGNFHFSPPIESDCAALWPLVHQLQANKIPLHCLRDLTRGGLAGALLELAQTSHLLFEIEEALVPVSSNVQAGCEILGLDPFFVANEGRMVLFVPPQAVPQTLTILKQFKEGESAACIGRVKSSSESAGDVMIKTPFGSQRKLFLLTGEQLPRIC